MDLELRGGAWNQTTMRAFSSSPNSLSSPPASLGSNPASPANQNLNLGRANIDMDEIVVDTAGGPRFGVMAPPQPPPPAVPLTAKGLPRKKPGRKPGSTVKPQEPKLNADGTPIVDAPKARKPRKPRDPNAPPIQRKRKAATQDPDPDSSNGNALRRGTGNGVLGEQQQNKMMTPVPLRKENDSPAPLAAASTNSQHTNPNPAKVPKREDIKSLLNDDGPPQSSPTPVQAPTHAPIRMAFDPVRSSSSYDPVRETMVTRDPYGTAGLSSPRAPSQMPNRASASPSISSLVDPPSVGQHVVSPTPGHASFTSQSRFQEASSVPVSPSQPTRKEIPSLSSLAPKPAAIEPKKAIPTLMSQAPTPTKDSSKASPMAPPTVPAPSKKVASVQAQTRKEKKAASSSNSSPKMSSLKNALPDIPSLPGMNTTPAKDSNKESTSENRSILDFGKAAPGEEQEAPSIVINIPLNGASNKYINFMRLAEETYGWDALHPRQAADRERKARIAAASAALEKQQGGRALEEEDPASEDAGESDDNDNADDSNVEMGGMGGGGAPMTSGAEGPSQLDSPENQPKPKQRKKRNWREDEYDKADGFVDDTDMLWEEQAAAVKDGFFVYSGPLVPEVPKPVVPEPAKRGGRGRGSRGGPGSRGGRGGAAAKASADASGEGGTRTRGGGPGSRGGATVRKPRITKLQRERMDQEKAERENMAKAASSTSTTTAAASAAGAYGLVMPAAAGVPSLSAGIGPAGVLAGQ